MTSLPSTVGVVGGGRMGSGIAQVFARAGSQVIVIERDVESAKGAAARFADGAEKAAAHDATVEAQVLLSRVSFQSDYTALSGAGLVVEAVPEQMELKVDALTRVESVVNADAWIATNTSSLSVNLLAEHLARPTQFCGLHFFNPVPPSTLVEVVIAERTSAELQSLAGDWVRLLGKTAITVHDAPGFASSRLGLALALEAMRMLEEGVASAEDIDAAMVLGYRHETGPLRTTDLVGLDVRLGISEYLHQTLGERFAPPAILREKVAAGELGRKTGRGFFDYTPK